MVGLFIRSGLSSKMWVTYPAKSSFCQWLCISVLFWWVISVYFVWALWVGFVHITCRMMKYIIGYMFIESGFWLMCSKRELLEAKHVAKCKVCWRTSLRVSSKLVWYSPQDEAWAGGQGATAAVTSFNPWNQCEVAKPVQQPSDAR